MTKKNSVLIWLTACDRNRAHCWAHWRSWLYLKIGGVDLAHDYYSAEGARKG